MPSVLIVGASGDRLKYGNKAVRAYLKRGWTVYPVNLKEPEIEGVRAYRSAREVPAPVDRAALYVPPEVGEGLLEEIAAARPRELYVNPGTESTGLLAMAGILGLRPVIGCAILDIGESPTDY